MSEVLEAIEIETGKDPTTSIIWLHGLGADGNDFATIVPELDLPKEAIRFVFPHAPVQPVTINGGMRMRAWYDIADGANRREDERIAGITALSTYVPIAEKLFAETSAANRDAPIFMAHGTYDPVVPLARAEHSRELLRSLGYPLEWREYGMPHSVCPEELADIGAWLGKVLGPGD